MNTFFTEWQLVLIPVVVVIISQFLKVALESARGAGFEWSHLNSYGGMPSSHTALFVSLSVTIGLSQGWTSALFAVTALISVVFIRDAVGMRFALGHHGQVLNHLLHELPATIRKEIPDKLEERLGHTPKEALAGAIVGALLTLLLYYLVNGSL